MGVATFSLLLLQHRFPRKRLERRRRRSRAKREIGATAEARKVRWLYQRQSHAPEKNSLLQVFPEERFDFVKRDFFEVVVEVAVACAGDDYEFLVFAGEQFEGVFAEVAAVRVFAVDYHDCAADFACECEEFCVQKRAVCLNCPAAV